MDIKQYLEAEKQKHVDAAKKAVDAAEKAGRSLTEDDRKEIEAHTKAAGEINTKLKDMQSNDELKAAIDALGEKVITSPAPSTDNELPAKSLGEAFTKSATYQALIKNERVGTWSTEPVNLDWFGAKSNETVVSTNVELAPSGYSSVLAEIRRQENTLMSLVPQAETDSNRVTFLLETTRTNNAAVEPELDAYVQSVEQLDTATADVYKVATILYVSDEFLEDVSGVRSFLDGRMASKIAHKEEDLVLNATGSTTIDGILNQTTQVQALGGDTVHDAVFKASTQVRTGGFTEPNALVVHPTDWQTIRLAKDGNDNYMNEYGPFSNSGAFPGLWGLTPVVTTRISQGTALVGAFDANNLQLFRKRGITLQATNAHSTFFASGQVAIRADSRFALCIYQIHAFCEITGL